MCNSRKKSPHVTGLFDALLDPSGLTLPTRLNHSKPSRPTGLNDIGDIFGLLIEQMRVARGKARLRIAHDEAIGEAVDVHPMQRSNAVRPILGQAQAISTENLESSASSVIRPDLEATRVD